MTEYPKLLVSSVVRGSRQGNSHGGLYIVDAGRDRFEQVLDWNTCDISFDGRGADRGLRGIVVHDGHVYIAASDELFVFNFRFEIVASYRNAYLKHCHEIWLHKGKLFLTSTGFDSVLRFDLAARKFDWGLQIQPSPAGLGARPFDPNAAVGPRPSLQLHLNNIFIDDSALYISGRKLAALLRVSGDRLSVFAALPLGTHNARPFAGGILVNDTEADTVCWILPDRRVAIPVPRYPEGDLLNDKFDESGVARQAFGRGLCPLSETIVAGGSSPSTVSIYDIAKGLRLKSVNITMDVRNAVHGMAVWPN